MPTRDDAAFLQIVDAALADSARRSGTWLACRPGCNQCCTGVFAIAPQDSSRLRAGLHLLAQTDRSRHDALVLRIERSRARLIPSFPGDAVTGILGTTDADQARFEDFANDEVCPVLDPATGTCDLYSHRPLTCRTFGPPVRLADGGLGVCELCFIDAPEAAIAAGELHLPPATAPEEKQTVVAFAFTPAKASEQAAHQSANGIIEACPPLILPART